MLTIASEDIVKVIELVDISKCGVLGHRIESPSEERSILTVVRDMHTNVQ